MVDSHLHNNFVESSTFRAYDGLSASKFPRSTLNMYKHLITPYQNFKTTKIPHFNKMRDLCNLHRKWLENVNVHPRLLYFGSATNSETGWRELNKLHATF